MVERDRAFSGVDGPLVKLNPLAGWSSAQTWSYIRGSDIPFNALHERGFVSIGCEPCTRAIMPGEHERAGRWWWEEKTKRECGLHAGNVQGGEMDRAQRPLDPTAPRATSVREERVASGNE